MWLFVCVVFDSVTLLGFFWQGAGSLHKAHPGGESLLYVSPKWTKRKGTCKNRILASNSTETLVACGYVSNSGGRKGEGVLSGLPFKPKPPTPRCWSISLISNSLQKAPVQNTGLFKLG